MVDEVQGNINLGINVSGAVASLKRLQAQVSEFHTSMSKAGGQANREAALLQQNLINSINKTGQFSASMTKVASSTEAFTTALEKNKLSMGQHFRYAMASTKSFGKMFTSEFSTIQKVAESRVRTLQTQFIGLGRDANGALSAIKVRPLTLDMKDLSVQTQIAAQKSQIFNKLVDQGATNLLNWGKNTQWAGRQLMVGFTIPLTMFASTASKAFMDLEKQVIAFKRVYGDFSTTKQQTDAMAESVKALANEFTQYGVAVKDTMDLAAKAAAMGKTGADLTAQIKETTRLAVLGQVDQQQALDTTISLTNAFGTAADQLAGKIDFLNAVENQTVTSISDLTIAIPKAGPVIKQMGGSVEDLTFLLTAMREGGINASEGANALKSGIAALINPTKTASDMLAGYGINIQKMVQSDKGDVKKLIIDFASSLDKLDPLKRAKAIEQMFGKFQFSRISTLFQNVIKEGSQANQVLSLASSSSQELAILSQRELSKVSESTTYKFEKAITDFQTALAPVGEQFLKLVTPIIEFGTKILEKFNSLDDGVKGFITTIVTGAGVVGPALLMAIGLFANAIANIITVVQFLRKTFGGAASSSKDVATQTEYMTQAQLIAEAAASSLNQTHSRLIQTYGVETKALDQLTRAYEASARAAGLPLAGAKPVPKGKKYATGGVVRGPGSGTSDSIPAMLSNGEAVIPAKQVKKYGGFIQSMISDKVPGFAFGGIMGKMFGAKSQNPLMGAFAKLIKSNPKIAVRMPSGDFTNALRSGDHRYKSIFETATTGGGITGDLNSTLDTRAKLEESMFGIPLNTAPSQRPVYGYLANTGARYGVRGKSDENSLVQQFHGHVTNSAIDRYGDTSLILKNAVKKRSSLTIGDSLNPKNFDANGRAITINPGGRSQSKINAANAAMPGSRPRFVEAQIFGGLPFSDIERVIVTNPELIAPLTQELRAAGFKIPVGLPKYGFIEKIKALIYKNKTVNGLPKLYNPNYMPKYANGVVSVPGPKGAGDVTPAMLSPGEAVIPTKMAKKYGGLINGMIADNIPGYEDALPVKRATVASKLGYNQGHFSGYQERTGQQLLDSAGSDAETASIRARLTNEAKLLGEIRGHVVTFDDILQHTFQVYDDRVVGQSFKLNNMLGQGGSAPASMVQQEYAGMRGQAHGRAASLMELAGVPTEKIRSVMVELADEVDLGIQDFIDRTGQTADNVKMSAAEVDQIFKKAYSTVSDRKGNEDLKSAYTKMQKINTIGSVKKTSTGSIDRIPITSESYKTQANKNRTFQAGLRNSETPDKPYLFEFGKRVWRGQDISTAQQLESKNPQAYGNILQEPNYQKRLEMLNAEAEKAGIQIVDSATQGITKGFDAATQRNSPPQEAIDAGTDYGNALTTGVRSTIDDAEVAGQNLGQATASGTQTAIDDSKKPTGQRVSRRSQRGAGTPGGNFTTVTRPREPFHVGGGSSIIIPVESYIPESEKPLQTDPNVDPNPGKSQKINKLNKFKGTIANKVSAGIRGMGAGGFGPGMGLATVGGMISMVPGLEGLGTAASLAGTAMMMIPGTAGMVVAGLVALGAGVIALNDAHTEQTKRARELADATVMSQAALQKMSEDFGTVSLTEQRKVKQNAELANVTEKQMAAGEQYIKEMESGQKLLAGVKLQQQSGMSAEQIGKSVGANMANAVAQNVITQKQGEEIIAALGVQSGDAQISSVASKNFKGYLSNPINTTITTAQQRNADLQTRADLIDQNYSKNLASDLLNPSNLLSLGTYAIKGLKGETAGQQKELGVKRFTQEATNAYGQSSGGMDVINAIYDAKVKEAKTQKEINDLEDERTQKLNEQRVATNLSYEAVKRGRDQLETYSLFGGGNDNRFLDSIKTTFSENSPAYKTAQEINKIGNADFKLRLQTQLESGVLSPEAIDALMLYGEQDKNFATSYELSIKANGDVATANLIFALRQAGIDGTNIDVILNLATNGQFTPEQLTEAASSIAQLNQLNGISIDVDAKGGEVLQKYAYAVSDLTNKLKDNKGKFSIKMIASYVGGDKAAKAVLASKEFEKLPKKQKIQYIAQYSAILSSGIDHNDPGYMGWANARKKAGKPVTDAAYAAAIMDKAAAAGDLGGDTTGGNNNGDGTGGGGTTEDAKLKRLNAQLDKRNKAMSIINLKEEKINKLYDERKKSLEEIAAINANIAKQQQDQLDLANALATGDVAAAAKAVQAQRATAAAYAQEQQMKALEKQRQSAIDNISFKGMTKKSLQAQIDKLNMSIAKREYQTASGGGMIRGYSLGGKVMSYMAKGGRAIGTDTVPAMLTPGEFVVRRPAVQKYGVDGLKAINSGQAQGGSVYNYSVTVNAATSSNADDIAQVVMQKIKQVEGTRLRGNRY